MIDGTEKPEIPLKFGKHSRDTNNLAISRDFLGYSKQIFLYFVLYHFMVPGNFNYGSEIGHGIFWGINFGPVIFFFFLKAKGFFWVSIFAPHSMSLEIRSSPFWLELSSKGR